MEQRLTIVTLGVSNLQNATDFYIRAFGWELSESSNENISFFKLNGLQLALFNSEELAKDAHVSPSGQGFKGATFAINTKSKMEVGELIDGLRKEGVDIVKEPKETNWGGYSAYISDLDGHLWEIAYNPKLEIGEDGNIL